MVWHTVVKKRRTFAKSDDKIEGYQASKSRCNKCSGTNLRLLYEDYYADNSGRTGKWEYLCEDCGIYIVEYLDD